jgi:hypothetical protein
VRIFYVSQEGRARLTIVQGVHYIPEAASSPLSVGELEDKGSRVIVDSLGKRITITRNRKKVLSRHRHRKVWPVSQTQRHQAYVIQERANRHDNQPVQYWQRWCWSDKCSIERGKGGKWDFVFRKRGKKCGVETGTVLMAIANRLL